MQIKIEDGVVTITCSVLEGKVLMQGANLMGNELDNAEEPIFRQHAEAFGVTPQELAEAVEECYTTLPNEDAEEWDA